MTRHSKIDLVICRELLVRPGGFRRTGPTVRKDVSFLICLAVLLFLFTTPAVAIDGLSEEELTTLSMFYDEKDLVVTPTRAPKPISQVAENMTIITAKEIEQMNAHTVAEVLNRVTGVFVDFNGQDFGSASMLKIQGSSEQQVLVLLDGIPWNYFNSATAETNTVPIHAVERIEIIKGPASSAWGSSLGGVINIVTKSTGKTKKPKGTVSASYGEQSSMEQFADLYGKSGAVGYYLYAGGQTSNGLRDNRYFDNYSFYSKLKINTGSDSAVTLTAGYSEPHLKWGDFPDNDLTSSGILRIFLTTASFEAGLTEGLDLYVSLYRFEQKFVQMNDVLGMGMYGNAGDLFMDNIYDEETTGVRSRLVWRKGRQTLVVGVDYRYGKLDYTSNNGPWLQQGGGLPAASTATPDLEEWAVYANDSIAVGKWSVTPGIRHDHNNISGPFTSPSLGITYRLSPDTILRTSAARGFTSPSLAQTSTGGLWLNPNPDLDPEMVWSYQAGVESVLGKHLKAKATAFQHDQKDKLTVDTDITVNGGKVRRRGGEVEAETVPVLNISFKGGFAYVDSKDFTTSETSNRYTWNLGLAYDDLRSIRAEIFGHYVWWDKKASFEAEYSDFLWDLNIIKRLTTFSSIKTELFFTVRNILNGEQYSAAYAKNPERWIESGIRARF